MGATATMQRGSSSTMRAVMAAALGSLAVMSLLYLAKRMEVNRTVTELEMTRLESRDINDQLNNRIATYAEEVDSLTRDKALLNDQLRNCRDTSAGQLEQVKKERDMCEDENHELTLMKDSAEAKLNQMKTERDVAVKDKNIIEIDLHECDIEKDELTDRNEKCEAENEQLHSINDDKSICTEQLIDCQDQLKQALLDAEHANEQVQTLEAEKKALLADSRFKGLSPRQLDEKKFSARDFLFNFNEDKNDIFDNPGENQYEDVYGKNENAVQGNGFMDGLSKEEIEREDQQYA